MSVEMIAILPNTVDQAQTRSGIVTQGMEYVQVEMHIPWLHALVPRRLAIQTGCRSFHLPEIVDNGAHSIVVAVVIEIVCYVISIIVVVVVVIWRLNGVASPCTRCMNHVLLRNFVFSKRSSLAQASSYAAFVVREWRCVFSPYGQILLVTDPNQ